MIEKIKLYFLLLVTLVSRSELKLLCHIRSFDIHYYLHKAETPGVRDPHPLFDGYFYRQRYLSLNDSQHPFAHYLTAGIKKGYKPGPYYDAVVFQRQFQSESGDNPLIVYNQSPEKKRLRTGVLFNPQWYLSQIACAVNKPLFHYRLYGIQKQRPVNPLMETAVYCKENSALLATGIDPVSLYFLKHSNEVSSLFPHFDPAYYTAQYPALDHDSVPLEAYLEHGLLDQDYPLAAISELAEKPLISIVVPVFNPPLTSLQSCLESVLHQSYPHWQLYLVDDGSENQQVKELLDQWSRKDQRINVSYLASNQGIAAATNHGLKKVSGSYVGFLDNDDELTIDCLFQVAKTINESHPDLIYTDEALIGEDGRHDSKFRKPDFNYGLLLSHNYMTHFAVVSASVLQLAGDLRSRCDGAQDYDLMLRVTEHTVKICHIPRVLYLWRASQTSTSINHEQKQYAHEAGKRALEDHLVRTGQEAVVVDGPVTYNYNVSRQRQERLGVTICVWPQNLDQPVRLQAKLQKMLTAQGAAIVYIADHSKDHHLQQEGDDPTSLTRVFDRLIRASVHDVVVSISDGVKTCSTDWLDTLAGAARQQGVGIVCGRISYNGQDGRSYKLPDLTNGSPLYFLSFLCNGSRHLNGLHSMQDVGFAPWENTMICRRSYLRVGGFDSDRYPQLFGLADLCIRLRSGGERIIYNPEGLIDLAEAGAPERLATAQIALVQEMNQFKSRYQQLLACGPPYYNEAVVTDHGLEQTTFSDWMTMASAHQSLTWS